MPGTCAKVREGSTTRAREINVWESVLHGFPGVDTPSWVGQKDPSLPVGTITYVYLSHSVPT